MPICEFVDPASADQADAGWTHRQRTGSKIGRDRLTINITKHDNVEKTSTPKQAELMGPTQGHGYKSVTNDCQRHCSNPYCASRCGQLDELKSSSKQRRRQQVNSYIELSKRHRRARGGTAVTAVRSGILSSLHASPHHGHARRASALLSEG